MASVLLTYWFQRSSPERTDAEPALLLVLSDLTGWCLQSAKAQARLHC